MNSQENRAASLASELLANGGKAFRPHVIPVITLDKRLRPKRERSGAYTGEIAVGKPRDPAPLRQRVALAEDTLEIRQRHRAPPRIEKVRGIAEQDGERHAFLATEVRKQRGQQAAAGLFQQVTKTFPAR